MFIQTLIADQGQTLFSGIFSAKYTDGILKKIVEFVVWSLNFSFFD